MQEQSSTIVGQVIFFLIPDWKEMKKDKQEKKWRLVTCPPRRKTEK